MAREMLLVLVLCGAAAAQETNRYTSEDKVFSIELPRGWVVERLPARNAVISLKVEVPGVGRIDEVSVFSVDGPTLTARSQAYYEIETQRKRWKADAVHYRPAPVPHLLIEYGKKKKVALYTYTRFLCRALVTSFECQAKDFPKLRAALLASGTTVRTTLGRFPPVAEGYTRATKNGIVYLFDKDVKQKDRRGIERVLAETQKRFVKLHGPIQRPPAEPPIVYAHARREDVAVLSKKARYSKHGNHADVRTRRLFAAPIGKKDSLASRNLAIQAWDLFFAEVYGAYDPEWMWAGESELLINELYCGKKAPFVTQSWHEGFQGLSHPPDELATIRDTDWGSFVKQSSAYVIFLRAGPPKYRKLYEKYLEHVRETGDLKDARRHLHEYGIHNLQREAIGFLNKKLKVVEAR